MLNTFCNHCDNKIFQTLGNSAISSKNQQQLDLIKIATKASIFFFLAVSCISDNNQSAEMMECLKRINGMPPLMQECIVPCRDDCTFTAWSKFTPCSTNCEITRSRRRQLTGRLCILFFSFKQVMLSWTCWGECPFQKDGKLYYLSLSPQPPCHYVSPKHMIDTQHVLN